MRCWPLTMVCSYLKCHQVAGLFISNGWERQLLGTQIDWLIDLFIHPSFIHSWFLFPKHFGLLTCASRHCAGCEEGSKVANTRSLS